ncbi:MAG: DUF927 domain-containing protein [Holosporales bacterium]
MNTLQEAINRFRTAAALRGLVLPSNIVTDGNIHRCDVEGAGGKDDGAYLFHSNSPFSGGFQNHRDTQGWKNWTVKNYQHFTAAERQHLAQRYAETRRKVHEDRRRTRLAAAQQAAAEWKKANPAPADHPYLKRKGVQPHGLRLLGTALLMPLRDTAGMIHTHQRILPKKLDNGNDKLLLKNGAKAGHFYLIGEPGPVICMAEGFATAASVHEATGYPVIVAVDAGNLTPVAKALRKVHPDALLILAADDDHRTDGNPGITKASEAAAAVGGVFVAPDFSDAQRGEKDTDFNDMAALKGLEAVKAQIEAAIKAYGEAEEAATVTAKNPDGDDIETGTVVSVSKEQRPCYRVFQEQVTLHETNEKLRPGVYSFFLNKDSDLKHLWLCDPLFVEAITCDANDQNYGRLLRFRNAAGRWVKWAMPMEYLSGGGEPVRAALLSMGLRVNIKARDDLAQYLNSKKPQRDEPLRCVPAVGWCGDVFVLPDTVIGDGADGVIFQSGDRPHAEYATKGSLEGWQQGIAGLAVGNPLLMLAISATFTGALLKRIGAPGGGGVHFYGESTTGKTTLLAAAAATWGGERYRRSWKSTANGIEAAGRLDVTHKKEAEKRRSRTFKINGRVERLYVITPAMEAV